MRIALAQGMWWGESLRVGGFGVCERGHDGEGGWFGWLRRVVFAVGDWDLSREVRDENTETPDPMYERQ
jgi:hypothetical protein